MAAVSSEPEVGIPSHDAEIRQKAKPPPLPSMHTDEPAVKQARLSKGDLYKPPTNEEMTQLKETENLFHSTLFRLQITELLREVRLKDQRRRVMEKATEQLTTILQGLPRGNKHELQDQTWLKKKVCQVPIVQKPWPVKGKFQFFPPANVKVTGSFPLETCVKPHVHIDLVAEMPKACFDTQDYMNHRYLRKRALYLCVIARKLSKMDEIEELKFTHHHGNHLKPILVVTVKVEGHKSGRFHLHAIPEEGYFRLNRFHLSKSNVRATWFTGRDPDSTATDESPTPNYNSCILQDLTVQSSQECLFRLRAPTPGLQEGVMLLKVWLRQRELNQGYGGFSGFIMSLFVVYLLSQRKLSLHMSSYQVMRNTLRWLAQSDWTREGITLCTDTADPNRPSLGDFHSRFDVVFVDQTGYLNVCSSINKFTFHRVKHEAQLSMEFLEDKGLDCFDMLFMRRVEFTQTFDHVFHITDTEALEAAAWQLEAGSRLLDLGGHYVHAMVPALLDRLATGLGSRIRLIQLRLTTTHTWDIKDEPPGLDSPKMLTFGLLLDSEFASNVLDKGPSAETSEAADFQEFWGSKSELRRFQDGTICEAVLWADKVTINKKRLVCANIVQYILERHASVPSSSVQYIAGQADSLLQLPVSQGAGSLPYGTGEEQGLTVNQAYDGLCKLVRRLADLPLTITSIQGVAPCFRHAEVFPPLPATFRHNEDMSEDEGVKRFLPSCNRPCPPYTPALKVICTLESSGKWPDDYEAMRHLKAAFHIQLGEMMKSNYSLPVKIAADHIDVLKDHYVFRLVLAYTKEIGMLKTVRTADGMVRKRDTDAALRLERETVVLPKLTSTLHGLQQQHNSFSTTVRLSKRWVSSQLLVSYIDEVAIELIVAHLYISPAPYVPPTSGLVGFQRFLGLLSTHDWKSSPLMVNLNDEFTVEDLAEIPMRFTKERATLPLLFISTPLAKYSSHWTKRGPSVPLLQRLVLLAQKSLDVIQGQITGGEAPDLKKVFRPPLEIYDVLIHLIAKQLPRQPEAVDITKATYIPSYGRRVDEDRVPVTDFDPVQCYLKDLRATFDDIALFFHDKHGGDVVAVLWKPKSRNPTDFKVSHINYSQPLTGRDVQLVANMDAIVEDMKVMGQGLVDRIEMKEAQT